jgi:DNA-binding transcriptional regulator YiaG
VKKKTDRMNGAQMQAALDRIGFSQVGFARTIGKGDRTIRGWIAGNWPVPREIAMLLNLMIKTNSTEKDLQA